MALDICAPIVLLKSLPFAPVGFLLFRRGYPLDPAGGIAG
jgi:hypothetical protein